MINGTSLPECHPGEELSDDRRLSRALAVTPTFDGETEELADGRNSIQAIVGWGVLEPDLRVTKVETCPS